MAKKQSSSVTMTPAELKSLIEYLIDNNLELQAKGKIPLSVNIVGPAGVSKTSCIEQIAAERKMNFVKLSVAQLEDPSDLCGFPYKEYYVCDKEGNCQWVNETNVRQLTDLGWKNLNQVRTAVAPPDWIKGKDEGGILLLDDSQRASLNILQACMDIVDRQSYISWNLPKGWTVITTNNPDDGNYLVTSTDNAHKTRQLNVQLKFAIKDWAEWAEGYGVDGRC